MATDDTNYLDEISLNMDMDGLEEEETDAIGDGAGVLNDVEILATEDSHLIKPVRPVLTDRMLAKKTAFEKERDKILDLVPKSAKDRFGKIYFSSFGKYFGPVLVMNPYRVSPGPVRDTWLSMFHKVESTGRLKYITHLVYWYGTSNDMRNAYSFAKSAELVEYEQGLKVLEPKLNSIKRKGELGKKISPQETNLHVGIEEMQKDLVKDPSERHGYVSNDFLEDYETPSGDEMPGDEEPLAEQHQSPNAKDRKKKGMNGKKKKKKVEEPEPDVEVEADPTDVDLDDERKETTKATTKGSKKKTKKREKLDSLKEPRAKKKAKAADANDGTGTKATGGNQPSLPTDDVLDGSKTAPEIGSEEAEAARLSAYEEALAAIGDVSSHDEADDDFDGGSAASGDDDVDKDYDVGSTQKPKKLKSKKDKDPPKERPKKKASKVKNKIEKRPKGQKGTASNENLRKAEQRRFEVCEMKFLKLIRQWGRAISNNDADQIKRVYVQLLENMDNFTAPFMEVYEMSLLMKQSKAIVNNDKRKEVMAAFKEAYPRKLAKVPVGFKAVKESEKGDAGRDTQLEMDSTQGDSKQLQTTKSKAESDNSKPSKSVVDSGSDEKPDLKDKLSERINKSALDDLTDPSGRSIEKSEVASQIENEAQKAKERNEQQQQKATPLKPERKKKFSLGTLMRPTATQSATSSSQSAANASSAFRRESSSGSLSKQNKDDQVHTWTEKPVDKDLPSNGNRMLALEFLEQAAAFIPGGKNINHDAIVRNLELAVFELANSSMALSRSSKTFNKEEYGRSMMKNEENLSTMINKEKQGSKGSQDEKERVEDEPVEAHPEDYPEPWTEVYWEKIHDVVASICGNETKDGTLATLIAEGKFRTAEEVVALSAEEVWKSFQGEPMHGYF